MRDVNIEAKMRLGMIADTPVEISSKFDHIKITKTGINVVREINGCASRNSINRSNGPAYERLLIMQSGLQCDSSPESVTIALPGKDCPRPPESSGYIFSHARLADSNSSGLVQDHWFIYKNSTHSIRHPDLREVPFSSKRPSAVWRGKNTGRGDINHNKNKIARQQFCDYYTGSTLIDSKIVSHYGHEEAIKMHDMSSDYKYLIFLEGNDTGSAVYWTFHNRNITLMPVGRKWHSPWDIYIKPEVHYIPFNYTITETGVVTDLEEKINWCEDHPKECEEIINNANDLSDEMLNVETESKVLREMFRIYNDNIIL